MTCNYVQVLMVVFEILSSHLHMARWHEAKIDQHTQDLEALQEAIAKTRERLAALDQEEPASPDGKPALLASPAENGALTCSQGAEEIEEEAEEDAGIAAVVERTLQQAVVSRTMAAGRSGALGASGSLEPEAPARSEAAEGSSPPAHAGPDCQQDAKADSSSAADLKTAGAAAEEAFVESSSLEERTAPDKQTGGAGDLRNGERQDPSGAGQAHSSKHANSIAGPHSSQAQPEDASAAAASPNSRPGSGENPGRAVLRRRSQADAKAWEREYLEGELDALAEKEQEEVPHFSQLTSTHLEGCPASRQWDSQSSISMHGRRPKAATSVIKL